MPRKTYPLEYRQRLVELVRAGRSPESLSDEYQQALAAAQLVPSMSRKGNCWDNAVAESFFGTLKRELDLRRPFPSFEAARQAVSAYIHSFYNMKRLHSTNGYRSPVDREMNPD